MSQNVNVNLTPGGYPKEFHVSQYDVGRQLVAKVVDSTGDYSIPSGATVTLVGTKPSGFGFTLSGSVGSGGVVTFSTTATVTAEYGRIPCEIRITSGDTVLGTANLMLIVEESPHQEGVIDGNSETVIPELTILVERVEAAASSVLDMQVEADTLPAGSSATYSYDEETNTATFGIPQGEAGAGAAGVVASAYSASSTYEVGDYVIHNSNLYRCTTAITTAEAFTAAHWTQVVLGDDVSDLKSDLNDLNSFDDYMTNVGCEYLSERTDGKLYWLSAGKVVEGDGNNTATYAPFKIRKGKTYYFNNLYAYFCFIVDESGTATRLSESTSNFVNGTYTATSNATMYVTINTSASVIRSFRSTLYRPTNITSGIYSVGLSVDGYTHISIKADGTGDYSSIVGAVGDIKDSSETNQYMLDIYEGTYYLYPDLGSEERQGSIWGLKLPDYVHLRGIGNRDNIFLTCTISNPTSSAEVEYTSCLNLSQNNSIENITFSGHNIRYVVHDESSNTYKNWHRNVKNCRFIHYGNDEGYWAYTDAWGEGCSSGSYSYFEDCIFENYSYVPPFKFHTNTDFEVGCTHIFKNCQFIQHYIGSDSSGAFGIVDIQCGKPINIEFVGCSFSSFIFVENYNSATDIEEINITGHGNSPVYVYPYRPNVSSPKKIFAKFSDEVAMVYNPYDAITAGRPLRYTSYTRNNVAVVQSDGTQCVGIALDEIPANGIGYMKYAGILDLSTVGVTGINIGDKVGVSSWSIAKVTDGSDFARAIQNNVIKFN